MNVPEFEDMERGRCPGSMVSLVAERGGHRGLILDCAPGEFGAVETTFKLGGRIDEVRWDDVREFLRSLPATMNSPSRMSSKVRS